MQYFLWTLITNVTSVVVRQNMEKKSVRGTGREEQEKENEKRSRTKRRRKKKKERRKEREKQAPAAYTSDFRSTVATSITNCASYLLLDHPNYKIIFVTHLIKHTISTIIWFISKFISLAKYALFHVIISPFNNLFPHFCHFLQTKCKHLSNMQHRKKV